MKLFFFIFSVGLFLFNITDSKCDESPGFFLKVVSKNIPRIGKRSDALENLFRKTTKNIPRIGKRNELPDEHVDNNFWYQSPYKRLLQQTYKDSLGLYEYNVIQPIHSNKLLQLIAKDVISSDGLKFITWKDFDMALQKDNDLFAKLLSLGAEDSLTKVKNELNTKNQYSQFYSQNNNDLIYYNNDEYLANDEKRKGYEYD